jgi:excinuclease UvrABC ATPase subunit
MAKLDVEFRQKPILNILTEFSELSEDSEAVDEIARTVNAFSEVGLEYGLDFIFLGAKEGKLHFRFLSCDALNLAIKAMRGE